MSNILIRGGPGTGKTFTARAMAYYMCEKNLSGDESVEQDACANRTEIEAFVNESGRCEFIQVHPSMEYDDIVYGLEIKASGGVNIAYAEKRIMSLCKKAKGEDEKYCIILDDINRSDVGSLLGNLLYAMEYREQDVELPDGNRMSIPENVILILTENTLDAGAKLDLAVRRRMTFLKELKSGREAIQKYYQGYIGNAALDLILDVYDRVRDYICTYFEEDHGAAPEDYVPGHGMFMVERIGTDHYILDNVRQKIRFQVGPHIRELYSAGFIKADPTPFIEQITVTINAGISGICPIESIQKKLIRSNAFVAGFSLADSRDYYRNTILPDQCKDYRGMMECVIDALIWNGVFPHDVLMSALLQNTRIAYTESLSAPTRKAAYMVEKSRADRFLYETVNGSSTGTHAYYTMENAATGRWAAQEDTEEYVVSYNDVREDEAYIPLSGFRNHGFNPESPKLSVEHNAANIMSAVHILLRNYLALYRVNLELIMDQDQSYEDLLHLIGLELRYLDEVGRALKKRSGTALKGDGPRLAYYGEKVGNLRLLWYGVDDLIEVDTDKFQSLVSGETAFTTAAYEDIFVCTGTDKKTIEIKGVLKMVDLKDYQKIMENIGIRQMIFQGPPGTSKTFTCKRFVLSQLDSSASSLKNPFASQEDISKDMEAYRLTYEDYDDPDASSKLQSGGWDLVQFHPSYGYEDFIRGIEVKIPAGSTTPCYESVNRILGKIAAFARAAADQAAKSKKEPKFYLIIDEINRANLATVFGELIYGLEYRNSKVSTPYEVIEKGTGDVTKDIILGKNLFILGTMNTADKSIDAIDYAIRRRFLFIDSPADREVVLSCYQNISGNTDENSIELLLFDAVQWIFEDDRFFNEEYRRSDVRIGHTYFLRDRKRGYADVIAERFIFQVIPILREYVKDGILDADEDLISMEHSVEDIHTASDGEERITMLGENMMLYVKEFGSRNKENKVIDNAYICTFIENLKKEFGY